MVKEYYNLVCPKAEKTALEKANKAVEDIDKQIAEKEKEIQYDPASSDPYRFVSIEASDMVVKAGKTTKVTVTTIPAKSASYFTWKTSNPKWATVDSNGVVTTKKAGAGHTVNITARGFNGSRGVHSIRISIVNAKANKIKLTASKKTVKAGKKVTIKAKTKKAVSWKTSNSKYSSISKKGVLKIKKKAKKGLVITVTATAKDGSGDSGTIKIKVG